MKLFLIKVRTVPPYFSAESDSGKAPESKKLGLCGRGQSDTLCRDFL